MRINGQKSGEYNKELGFRLTKCFKSATIVIGFYWYIIRIEL